jgi:two-component system, OmpR family, response regulator
MRVLYVDDDRIHSLLFVEACRTAGNVDVQTAATGAEALELVRDWSPDLLVIDLHLPDTTGYKLLPALRERIGPPLRPAFLCTAEDAPLAEAPAEGPGFDGLWTKPVDLQVVLRELGCRGAARDRGE